MGVDVEDIDHRVDDADSDPPSASDEVAEPVRKPVLETSPLRAPDEPVVSQEPDKAEHVRSNLDQPTEDHQPKSSLQQSVVLLGSVNLAAFLGGIIRQKVFAVALGPVGIGALSLATAFLEVLLNISRMGAPTGLLREASQRLADEDRSGAARVFSDVRRLQWIVSGTLVVVSVPLAPWAADVVFRGVLAPWMIPVIVLAVPLSIGGQLAQTMINAVGDVPRLALTKMAITGVGLLVSLVAVLLFGLNGAVVQLLIAAVVSAGFSRWALGRRLEGKGVLPSSVDVARAKEAVRAVFRIGRAEAASHVAISLNLLFFRSFLVGSLGLVDNGIYQGVMGLSRQYTVALSGAVFVYLYPKIAAAVNTRSDVAGREVRSSLRFILSIGIPAALVLLSARDVLVPLLLSEEFRPMIPLLGYTAPGDLLALNVALFQIVLLAMGRTRAFVALSVGGELLYAGLFVLGVTILGLKGAVLGYLVWGLAMVPLYVRAVGLKGRWWGLEADGVRLLVGLTAVAGIAVMPIGSWTTRIGAVCLAIGWAMAHRRELLPVRANP